MAMKVNLGRVVEVMGRLVEVVDLMAEVVEVISTMSMKMKTTSHYSWRVLLWCSQGRG